MISSFTNYRPKQCYLPISFYSDESTFYLFSFKGYQHDLSWYKTNPFDYCESNKQDGLKVNAWCRIHGLQLVGLVFLPNEVNAVLYLDTIQENLPLLYLGNFTLIKPIKTFSTVLNISVL